MTAAVLALILTAPPTGIPATRVALPANATVTEAAVEIERQTGVRIDLGPTDPAKRIPSPGPLPFWEAIDRLGPVSNVGPGRVVKLAAGQAPPHSLDGPFRVTAKGISARADFTTGGTYYDLALEVAWEPRFPVFRIDSSPTITAGTDDRGSKVSAPPVAVKTAVAGYTHAASIRLDGLTRQSAVIKSLSGKFTVTASPKTLAVPFDDLTAKPPLTKTVEGVVVSITRIEKDDDRWEIDVSLTYPPGHPEFESFETWASANVLTLIPPGGKPTTPTSFELSERGRAVAATYRFKGIDLSARRGWRLVYQTPAPLVEFPVNFTLKDIRLP